MENVRAAAVTMHSTPGHSTENVERIEHYVREAALQNVEIICFPEASITGYSVNKEAADFAEPVPGPGSEAIVQLARETGITILCGLIEKDQVGHLYISHIVATPEGLDKIYRKLHLSPKEELMYTRGEELPAYTHKKFKFGIELCYDSHFPELTSALTLKGIEVLFIPFASPHESLEEKYHRWMRYLPARAYDNSIFVVACNQVGEYGKGIDYPGIALFLNPKGKVVTRFLGEKENIIIAELSAQDIQKVRKSSMGNFMRRRRPELYII